MRASVMDAQKRGKPARRIEITGEMDRSAAEALQLEIRRLAKQYGLEIGEFRVEEVEDE